MRLEKKELGLKEGIKKEWVITNGVGAFCSSSVIGANTRRYHGLLIAPLLPPAKFPQTAKLISFFKRT